MGHPAQLIMGKMPPSGLQEAVNAHLQGSLSKALRLYKKTLKDITESGEAGDNCLISRIHR
jgi:hypothetical protein